MNDAPFMALALAQAQLALNAGEVPVGAVVVKNGAVIAVGHNTSVGAMDPTGHAEMAALRAAAQTLGNYRLDDCELFVTLEPCAMCAGAMLHARLNRVVFGATDPKTGAAGSVLNVFAHPQINHQTQVQGGVLADECAALLQTFFKRRRKERSQKHEPVRQDALRPNDVQFASLPDYPWTPRYLTDLPALAGLRLHYLEEGPRAAPLAYFCLHDHSAWSYAFRTLIPELLTGGGRVVVPDLIGFGKSDKPKKDSVHTLAWHGQVLLEMVERLGLQETVLLVQGDNQVLGHALVASAPERFLELRVLEAAQLGEMPPFAAQAPFPDRGHRAALRAFKAMAADADSHAHASSKPAAAHHASSPQSANSDF